MTIFTIDLPPSSLWSPVAPMLCFPLWSLHLKSTLDACPCIPTHRWATDSGFSKVSVELHAKNAHAISIRNAEFVPLTTWLPLLSAGRGRQGDLRGIAVICTEPCEPQRGRAVTAVGRPEIKQDSLWTKYSTCSPGHASQLLWGWQHRGGGPQATSTSHGWKHSASFLSAILRMHLASCFSPVLHYI